MSGVELAPHIEAVARHLYGEPNRVLSTAAELRWGRRGSLAVHARKGVWRDYEAGTSGGVLDLIRLETGLACKDAVQWLERELGVRLEDRPRRTGTPAAKPNRDDEIQRHSELAQETWRQSHPLCHCARCGPGRAYLASRGIKAWPEGLYFHPECPFKDELAPAIVAPVNSAQTGLVVGIWRVRLTTDGAKVERRGLGPARGNASRLFWPEGDELAVTEGVEDALAFHELTGLPTWAALSAGNMRNLPLPAYLHRVTIVADGDETGRRAAHDLATRLRQEGRHAVVIRPSVGKDANDVLLGSAA